MKKYVRIKTDILDSAWSLDQAKTSAHDSHGWHVLEPVAAGKKIEEVEGLPGGIAAWCVRGKRRAAIILAEPAGFILEEFLLIEEPRP